MRLRKVDAKRLRSRRLALESLENRALLTASVDGTGLLTVVGTERADAIVISAGPTAGSVSLRGVAGVPRGTVFAGVTAIQVSTLGGGDRLTIGANIRDSGGNLIGVVADTGRGNDTFDGGEGDDEVRAGDGNDIVRGRGGADEIWLGPGNDSANGGDGADTIHGDAGRDTIVGAAGDDSLGGGADNDSLSGDGDDDSLSGGTGNDVLSGGFGDDQLDGDEGRDRLRGGRGNDDNFDDADGLLDENDDDEGPNDHGSGHDDAAGATPVVFAVDGTAQVTGTSANRRDKKLYAFTVPADRTLSVTILAGSDGRRPDLEVGDVTSHRMLLELEPQDGGPSTGSVVLLSGHTYSLRLRSPDLAAVAYSVDLLMQTNG
ncbi:MAG: hypothetical protein DWI03_00480 [Planctomycetota bacterium]|jgi:Ca2+-binding RTX toxin-like protein|nr:MAG: hypothetical protein DWI03_00480 [Planctomycetota bacterium]